MGRVWPRSSSSADVCLPDRLKKKPDLPEKCAAGYPDGADQNIFQPHLHEGEDRSAGHCNRIGIPNRLPADDI